MIDILDSALEQDNYECEAVGTTEHPEFAFKDPDDVNSEDNAKRRYKSIVLADDISLDQMSSQLDKDQRKVFDICIDYAISIKKS